MKQGTDTSLEAERVWVAAHRAMSPARKWTRLNHLYRFGRELHAAGLRFRNPAATPADIRNDWIANLLGELDPGLLRGASDVNQPTEFEQVVCQVIGVFERLEIDYALGGSLASSIYGISRFTSDADMMVEPFHGQETLLAGSFGPEYYLDLGAIRRAVADRASFNIINTVVGFKVDVFVRKDRPFETSLMRRRVSFQPSGSPGQAIKLVSPEDVVLLKLEWYRLGGEVSDRQWSDVLGVLRARSDTLDRAYLEHWATELGVKDLMDRAESEAEDH
jgi:hypothetical protein